jgi:uncharacterized protein YjbI with pentapeptide repeats
MRNYHRKVSHDKLRRAFESHRRYFDEAETDGPSRNRSVGRPFNRQKVNFCGFDFAGTNAKFASIRDSTFVDNNFLGTSLEACSFRDCNFKNIDFNNTDFRLTYFIGCNFTDCDFSQTNLFQVCFYQGCNFENCKFGISLLNIQCWLCDYKPEILPWLILLPNFRTYFFTS